MNPTSTLNTGVINTRLIKNSRTGKSDSKKTVIVTGVARSGTSLVASVLKAAGLYLGEFVYDVVNEDAQMLEILRSHNLDMLRTLIQQRNAQHARWGFKIPNMHVYLRHDELSLFRNPHLIVIYRDPVAIAVRNSLSEHYDELESLNSATSAMHAIGHFAALAKCPLLLISYEKALAFPNLMIDSVLDFCGITLDDMARNELFRQFQPNNAEYLAVATRRFVGRIDGFMDGELYGWCFQEGRLEPVRLDLYADDQLIESFRADKYRGDLASGGVGNGSHGFFVDLSRHALRGNAVIRVKVAGRVLELQNSGQRMDRFDAQVSAH